MDEPIIEPADIFYIKAFYDLGTCRSNGMSLGPIPWSAMIQYAEWYGLDRDVTEAFVDIVREMDTAYLNYQAEEQKRHQEMRQKSRPSKVQK